MTQISQIAKLICILVCLAPEGRNLCRKGAVGYLEPRRGDIHIDHLNGQLSLDCLKSNMLLFYYSLDNVCEGHDLISKPSNFSECFPRPPHEKNKLGCTPSAAPGECHKAFIPLIPGRNVYRNVIASTDKPQRAKCGSLIPIALSNLSKLRHLFVVAQFTRLDRGEP